MVTEADLAHRIGVDSVGTHDFHVGEPPDHRALQAGRARGYEFGDLRARQLDMQDFIDFHLILAMHREHYQQLLRRCLPGTEKKLAMFLDAAPESGLMDVPDPYHGEPDAFEHTLDLIESGSRGWLNAIRADLR
jgi:protein-tyrosine phosphatase